jgi:hypothetical protein
VLRDAPATPSVWSFWGVFGGTLHRAGEIPAKLKRLIFLVFGGFLGVSFVTQKIYASSQTRTKQDFAEKIGIVRNGGGPAGHHEPASVTAGAGHKKGVVVWLRQSLSYFIQGRAARGAV